MSDGIYRDEFKMCAFCGEAFGDAESVRVKPKKGAVHHFHDKCWTPFENEVRADLEDAVRREEWAKNSSWTRVCSKFWHIFGVLLFVTALCFAALLSGLAITASEEVEFCRIKTYENPVKHFALEGIVSWASDTTIGKFQSLDEAVEGARKVGCEIK